MSNQVFFGLINLGGAIALFILLARARKDRQLRITLITSGGVTKVEKVVLTGKGLTVAIIGWSFSAILFTYSGLSVFVLNTNIDTNLLLTLIGIILFVFTMLIASYVTIRSKE